MVRFGLVITCLLCLGCRTPKKTSRVLLDRSFQPVSMDCSDTSFFQKNAFLLTGSRIVFNYSDSLGFGQSAFLEKKQNLFYLNAPAYFSQDDGAATPYLIYPGDKIKLKVEPNGNLLLLGDNQIRNNELNFIKEMIEKVGPTNYDFEAQYYLRRDIPNFDSPDSIYALQKLIDERKLRRLKFLVDYASNHPVSERFMRISSNLMGYYAQKDSLALFERHRQLLKKNDLFEPMLRQYLNTINACYISEVNSSLGNARRVLKLLLANPAHMVVNDSISLLDQFWTTDKYFTGKARNILMTQSIMDALLDKIPVPDTIMNVYFTSTDNPEYKEAVISFKRDEDKIAKDTKSDPEVLVSIKNKKAYNTLQSLIEDQQQLVVVDFWASWCKPCREAMPASLKAKADYKSKGVSFVYISVDQSLKNWKLALASQHLPTNSCWNMPGFDNSVFKKKYTIGSIPRYMIFDKTGKLISADAPAPGSAEFNEMLDKNL